MSLLPALAWKNGQGCSIAVLNTLVEGKCPLFTKQFLNKWMRHCFVVKSSSTIMWPFQRNIPFKQRIFPASMILTIRVSNRGFRRVVHAGAQTVPWKAGKHPHPHLSLCLRQCGRPYISPSLSLLFTSSFSLGRLLPPIHLLCEAAARPRPPSWTAGKQSDWSCVQGSGFPP